MIFGVTASVLWNTWVRCWFSLPDGRSFCPEGDSAFCREGDSSNGFKSEENRVSASRVLARFQILALFAETVRVFAEVQKYAEHPI